MNNVTEAALWAWCNAHPWWWHVVSVLGGLVAFRIFRLAPALTLWGRTARVVLLTGCGLSFASYWNTGFGLIAPVFILFGLWMVIEQMITACLEARKIRPMPWRRIDLAHYRNKEMAR